MTGLTLSGVRKNVAAYRYANQSQSEQRRRTNAIVSADSNCTTDPRAMAAAVKRQKADDRRNRAHKSGIPKKLKVTASRAFKPRHVYLRGTVDAYDYEEHKKGMKSAARQEQRQSGFPDAMRHALTLGAAIVQFDSDLKDEINIFRPGFRGVLDKLTEGRRVDGAFQVEIKYASELARIFPEEEWPDGFDPISEPNQMWGYLHFHGVICDPWFTKNEVRRLLKRTYPGINRVCIRRIRRVTYLDDGTETGGAQGFLEYAWLNRCRGGMKTTRDTADAISEFTKMDTTWTNRSRVFSFGLPLAKSGVVINPERVGFVETQDRVQWVKDHWDELDYAQQFIHLWFSGMIERMASCAEWITAFGRGVQSVRSFMRMVTNWVTAPSAKDVDISDIIETPIRE